MGIASPPFLASSKSSDSRIWGFQCIIFVQARNYKSQTPNQWVVKAAITIPSRNGFGISMDRLYVRGVVSSLKIEKRTLPQRAQIGLQTSNASLATGREGRRIDWIEALSRRFSWVNMPTWHGCFLICSWLGRWFARILPRSSSDSVVWMLCLWQVVKVQSVCCVCRACASRL